MATTLKTLIPNQDIATTKTNIHEIIPLTGSVISGTFGRPKDAINEEPHIRYYSHGMFSSMYDFPYLSSSANHLFDITFGFNPNGEYKTCHENGGFVTENTVLTQSTEKKNIYNQMASMLVGHDITGAIKPFDHLASNQNTDTDQKFQSAIFMNFSRLLVKDEIKKGTFEMTLGTGSYRLPFEDYTSVATWNVRLTDSGSLTYTNSPAGEYGILYSASAGEDVNNATDPSRAVGLIYYQAGVVALELSSSAQPSKVASLFSSSYQEEKAALIGGAAQILRPKITQFISQSAAGTAALRHWDWLRAVSSGTIDQIADGFRHRIKNVSFQNTTELNSTVYSCKVGFNDFNYSSNKTYLNSQGKINVKEVKSDSPISYVTTVGLYSSDGALLASAKLSKPLKNTPVTEFNLRVRLDY